MTAAVDPEAWRLTPPRRGKQAKYRPPHIETRTLSNGLPVYIVENRTQRLVVARVVIRVGTSVTTQDTLGLPALVANALDEGAGSRDAAEIAEESDRLASDLTIEVTPDASSVTIEVLRDDFEASLELLADVVLRPRLSKKDITRAREDLIATSKQRATRGSNVALAVLKAEVFGLQHPYGAPESGTEATLARLKRAEVLAFHRRYWHPGNAAIVIVGDIGADEAVAALERRFGSWRAPKRPVAVPAVEAAASAAGGFVVVDRPSAAQVDIAVGLALAPANAADLAALLVANMIFGGSYESRLNQNIREQKGYSYNVRSRIVRQPAANLFWLRGGLKPDKVTLSLVEIQKELARLAATAPTDDELAVGKAATLQLLASQFETGLGTANTLGHMFASALPQDYYDAYVELVSEVTAKQVRDVVSKYLPLDQLVMVMVGPSDQLIKDLAAAKLAPVVQRTSDGREIKAP